MTERKACRIVAKLLGENVDLVHDIVMHQFNFIKEVMQDPEDIHDILINKLFRFKLKTRFKEDKKRKYSSR